MTFTVKQRTAARDLVFFLAGFYILWTIRGTLFYAVDESITSPVWRAAYSSLLKFVLWVLPAAAFACLVRRRPPASYMQEAHLSGHRRSRTLPTMSWRPRWSRVTANQSRVRRA